MSTKIYDGLRIVPKNMKDIHDCVQELREEIIPKADRMLASLLIAEAIDIKDQYYLLGKDKHDSEDLAGKSPMMVAMKCIRKRIDRIKETGRRDPEVDFEFKITLYPVQGRNMILAIPTYEQKEFYQILMGKTDFVQDYAYWNNSDKPDGMPGKTWERRGDNWDKVFDDMRTYMCGGYTVTIADPKPFLVLTDAIDMFKTTEDILPMGKRISRLAKHDAYQIYISRMTEEQKENLAGRWFTVLMDFERWIKGEYRFEYNMLYQKYSGLVRTVDLNELYRIDMKR